MEKHRTAIWDNAKFLMITLVVIGHFANVFYRESNMCQAIYLFIYAFHIPVLFFISVLFFKRDKIVQRVFFYVSSGFVLKMSLAVAALINKMPVVFNVLSDPTIPWFFFVLAAFYLITWVSRPIDRKFLLTMSVLLACFAGYDQTVGDFLYLSRTLVFFPYFLLGTMVSRDRLEDRLKNRSWILLIASAAILLLWAYLCIGWKEHIYSLRFLFTGRSAFTKEVIGYGPLARLLCYGISLFTGAGVLLLTPGKTIPPVTRMGAKTLNVYYWHWIITPLMLRWGHLADLFYAGVYGKAAYFMLAVLMTMILSLVPWFDYPLKIIKEKCCLL